jgi:hypothetical protein
MREISVEQGSYEWRKLRIGRITGTRLGDAVGSPKVQQTLLCELLAEQMTEQDKEIVVNAAMERGTIEEAFARKEYEKRTGVSVAKCGFIVADINEKVGFSPDGVVREAGQIVGGIEIKNPDSKTHISYLLAGELPKDYFHQVAMAFVAIPTVQWWDFVSYDSRVKLADKRMLIKRVHRADLPIADIERDLLEFIKRWDETYTTLIF